MASIARLGLLSHLGAERLPHRSVALESAQRKRKGKRVPNGGLLHSYANLYFNARNPMMSRLVNGGEQGIVVLRFTAKALDIPGAVIADGNAASSHVRFFASPEGLENLDTLSVFARSWVCDDPFEQAERKRQCCAELLVPNKIAPEFIFGCYTLTPEDRDETYAACQSQWRVEVNRNVYLLR
ncbi:DUF4433 domain-containing protein [Streptomyces chrestomyceticus]|uniref:DUF4433 domain-containing protein n=1 Tax=Streptomyces chrestomyceticus TaxID=68185 RepID=UPI0033FBCBFD